MKSFFYLTPVVLVAIALTGGCNLCPVGDETCGCYGNQTCNDGLVCLSGLCVNRSSPDSLQAEVVEEVLVDPDILNDLDVLIDLCNRITCSTHGTCKDGACECDEGFYGSQCDQCNDGYVDYPICYKVILCDYPCGEHGYCDDQTGECVCQAGFQGAACDSCSDGYLNFPACYWPIECDGDCSGNGSCDEQTGECSCSSQYQGSACDACASGYKDYPTCYKVIPCVSNCSNYGICNDRTGECIKSCSDQCSLSDPKTCSGNTVKQCTKPGNDMLCLSLTTVQTCSSNQTCQNGQCVCSTSCTVGSTKCGTLPCCRGYKCDFDYSWWYSTCVRGADGCSYWVETECGTTCCKQDTSNTCY